jgi:hypothetical protein
MPRRTGVNTKANEILLPILASQLESELFRLLRELAQNYPRKRGQPPKPMLAAAKVLDTRYPAVAYEAARMLTAQSTGAKAGRSGERNGSTGMIDSGTEGDTGRDAEAVDLDAETASTILGGLHGLDQWLATGGWAGLAPSAPVPELLAMIEEAASVRTAEDLTAIDLTADHLHSPTISTMIDGYRDLMQWGRSFVEQRPADEADRDELVLLTAVRIKLLHQPQMPQNPVQAKALLTAAHGRLEENWGDTGAVGVNAFSRGHFGNDHELFNDVCRAMVVDLLNRAVEKGPARTVYLSTGIFDGSTGRLRAELDQKIGECLAAGWRVVHVLDRAGPTDVGPTARVQADFATHMVVDLETKGRYVPLRSAPPDSTDMVLADGVGAVVFPSVGHASLDPARGGGPPSPAMAIRCITGRGGTGDGPAATPIVAELRAEAKALYSEAAEDNYLDKRRLRFGYRVPTEDLLWFDRQLTASELLEGDRYALKAVLPTSTLPDELTAEQYRAWSEQLQALMAGTVESAGLVSGWPDATIEQAQSHLNQTGWPGVEQALRRLRSKRNVRHFGFETNTAHNRYRDLVLKSQIEQYLTEEDPWYDPNPLYGPGGLTLNQRREHMLYLAGELEKTRASFADGQSIGYDLGLIDDQDGQPYDLVRTWWLATRSVDGRADQVHYLHNPPGKAATYVAILKEDSLAEFEAVDTFVSLFDGVWYTIKPEDRSPATVIDFILERLPSAMRRRFKRA